jgi:hypothetical protein
MEHLVKPEILTSFIYMDLRLATLKAVSFYLLHNVSILDQCRKFSCVAVVRKHFAKDSTNFKLQIRNVRDTTPCTLAHHNVSRDFAASIFRAVVSDYVQELMHTLHINHSN